MFAVRSPKSGVFLRLGFNQLLVLSRFRVERDAAPAAIVANEHHRAVRISFHNRVDRFLKRAVITPCSAAFAAPPLVLFLRNKFSNVAHAPAATRSGAATNIRIGRVGLVTMRSQVVLESNATQGAPESNKPHPLLDGPLNELLV